MIGVYKITNPSGRVYIGQSVDIEKRKYWYSKCWCKEQKILRRSFLKYGFDAHIFEVVEECELDELDEREIYYIGFYKSNINKHREINGMNLRDGGKGGIGYKHTKESLRKMSIFQSNRIRTDEWKKNLSIATKGKKKPEGWRPCKVGFKEPEHIKRKRLSVHLKPVVDTENGKIYASAKEAWETDYSHLNYDTLTGWLRGDYLNKTSLLYLK